MPKVTKAKSNKHYEWAITPDLYIATSLLLSKQMLYYTKLHDEVDFGSEIIKKLGLRSSHANYELILPLIFNFKQGIELYIKALGIIDYGKYTKVHNLKTLLEKLKKSSKGTKNNKIIKQLYKETWPVIKKYYYGRYIPSKQNSNFADVQNEAERYPEYKSRKKHGKIYKIPERYEWVTKAVLEDIEKDIRLIESKFAQAKRDITPTKTFIYGRSKR